MVREDGLLKYPRTPHLQGSRLQVGDSVADQVPYAQLVMATAQPGIRLVVEEKLDGANAGLSFGAVGELRLQSRGHFLAGGGRERHFNLLKQWAHAHEPALREVIGTRYIVFGEWMFAKHSLFYDALPHWFLEFDVFDQERGYFLSTPARARLLEPLPMVSVPVLQSAAAPARLEKLIAWVQPSLARTPAWREQLVATAKRERLDPDRVQAQTDSDEHAEGLYLKIEDEERVLGRFKWIRPSFVQTLLDTGEHWQQRPIVPNGLRPGVDIFAPTVDKTWPSAALASSRPPRTNR